ncbi:porin [Limibacter armeniacum]|uniref:porin n=1 Tax=Limibacter armeniacum TaxID=466084 RepID=UPI002FE65679
MTSLWKNSYLLLWLIMVCLTHSTFAQEKEASTFSPNISYGSKGFEFKSGNDLFSLQFQSRLQFRFATPRDQDPLSFDDFREVPQVVFKINRARLKVGGHAYKSWLKYYWEYELARGNLLDFRIMIEKWDFFRVKVGQWKTYYTRERVISSGKQQMVDRSIVNRPFTLDRQQGVEISGRVETIVDFSYYLSVLTGTGRAVLENDDRNLMYVGRLQWNIFGKEVDMSGSDIPVHESPAGIIALGAATNQSRYTRFSSAGGGQLEGFESGEAGQYKLKQYLVETAFKWKGFSWQHETHWKRIDDRLNGTVSDLEGSYFQAGYFFGNIWDWFPMPLELAGRFAYYRPIYLRGEDKQDEYGLAFNWFFVEHRNKLTAECSYFKISENEFDEVGGARFRVQWEISF